MNKTFLIFTFLLLSFTNCTTDSEERTALPEPTSATGNTIPVDEALAQLSAFQEIIAPGTRSGGRSIRDIQVCGGSQATRSTENDLPDTLVYVVNFDNNQGFAVLGAQRSLEPVYAITESGSFDAGKLNAAIAEAQRRMQETPGTATTRTTRAPEGTKEIGLDFVYPMLATAMVATPRFAPYVLETKYGPWQITSASRSLVEVKWGQMYPFNMSMKETTLKEFNDVYHKGRFPVGCGIVAAAQIMCTTKYPNSINTGTARYSWEDLKYISQYTDFRRYNYKIDTTALDSFRKLGLQQLAETFNYLADLFRAYYFEQGTGVNSEVVAEELRKLDRIHYGKAVVVPFATYKESVYKCLDDKKPLYITGDSHAWVLDGYVNASRSVTRKLQMGFTGPIWDETKTEVGKLLHFNWGDNGSCDGYYAESVVAPMNLRIAIDNVIDRDTDPEDKLIRYTNYTKVILY